jgi:succinyl-diaminopimelate desuccinylase
MVNPPGAEYEACANVMADQLRSHGAEVQMLPCVCRAEHTAQHPRVNVVGRRDGAAPGPAIHLNGHFDVVPAGQDWTRDPFGGERVQSHAFGRANRRRAAARREISERIEAINIEAMKRLA